MHQWKEGDERITWCFEIRCPNQVIRDFWLNSPLHSHAQAVISLSLSQDVSISAFSAMLQVRDRLNVGRNSIQNSESSWDMSTTPPVFPASYAFPRCQQYMSLTLITDINRLSSSDTMSWKVLHVIISQSRDSVKSTCWQKRSGMSVIISMSIYF